jgi:hypothetical protein
VSQLPVHTSAHAPYYYSSKLHLPVLLRARFSPSGPLASWRHVRHFKLEGPMRGTAGFGRAPLRTTRRVTKLEESLPVAIKENSLVFS